MDILFAIIGMIPIGISIFWFYELRERQKGFYYGLAGAVSLLLAGISFVGGLQILHKQSKPYILILAAVLFILSIVLYKFWKHKK